MSKVIKRWPCNYIPNESTAIPTGVVKKADVALPPSPLIESLPATVDILPKLLGANVGCGATDV